MKARYIGSLAAALVIAVTAAGCGGTQQQAGQATAVNAYKITASDTQVESSFAGSVIPQNKVAVHARVTGHVLEKYVQGGERVTAGQPLFKLDNRQYEASLASAQATAAQANAAYRNSELDLSRYQTLANEDAIARQTLDTQASTAAQNRAAYEAYEAQVKIAQDNLNDTVIYAPFDGTLEMDDVDLGTFVTAGSTTLVTLDSSDPVYVEFSMSEAEYLALMNKNGGQSSDQNVQNADNLQLKLADGSTYAYPGHIVQASKALDSSTGKLVMKAQFPNPDHLLLPGMYATVVSPGATLQNAILIPTKALTQVLDKSFVMVVQEDGKVKQVPVTVGSTQGAFTIINGGIQVGEEIVVDGLTKIRNGSEVKATLVSRDQLAAGK